MEGVGQGLLSVSYCQLWLLISTYESRMMYFPRAWLSSGKASRIALMLGLNCLDGPDLEAKQTLPGRGIGRRKRSDGGFSGWHSTLTVMSVLGLAGQCSLMSEMSVASSI